jgi:hypothetical protein
VGLLVYVGIDRLSSPTNPIFLDFEAMHVGLLVKVGGVDCFSSQKNQFCRHLSAVVVDLLA